MHAACTSFSERRVVSVDGRDAHATLLGADAGFFRYAVPGVGSRVLLTALAVMLRPLMHV
jgi:hypothetical protein